MRRRQLMTSSVLAGSGLLVMPAALACGVGGNGGGSAGVAGTPLGSLSISTDSTVDASLTSAGEAVAGLVIVTIGGVVASGGVAAGTVSSVAVIAGFALIGLGIAIADPAAFDAAIDEVKGKMSSFSTGTPRD